MLTDERKQHRQRRGDTQSAGGEQRPALRTASVGGGTNATLRQCDYLNS